jgi:WD40 repeat protein
VSRERFRRVEEVYQSALDRTPPERAAFVSAACGGDAAMQAEVMSLLDAVGEDSVFLSESVPDAMAGGCCATQAMVGTRVGAYHITDVIGEGGMGVVYRATRADGQFEMTVALKIMRPAPSGRDSLRRFRQERQVLARLDHPGIARLVDGGTTADGRPYFAMELVDGRPIDRYCREEGLGIPDRLRLLVQAAEAVQAAHEALVIHRDLKPSNILVDARGNVRIIDFGIALPMFLASGETMHTRAMEILGTLAYMSPEQCRLGAGGSLDVRCDVYSLGAVLYELLTGRTPHDLEGITVVEAIERITRGTPVRPSALDSRCVGDIETIVLKAIDHDVASRYGTAGELASDMRRYLANEPIHARAASRAYLARKFVRRHRVGVGLTAAAITGLVATTVVTVVQAHRAESARAAERLHRDSAEWSGYVAAIGAAVAALQTHQPHIADGWLASTPEELRGWEWEHLRYRLDQSRREVLDLGSPAKLIAVSPDGELVAAASDSIVRVVRGESGAPVASFAVSSVHASVSFLQGGQGLVWPAAGGNLAVGDINSASVNLIHCGGEIRRVACSPDGRWIVVGLTDGRVRVLERSSMAVAFELGNLGDSHIHQLAFSADGSVLAAVPWKGLHIGKVFVWRTADWSPLCVVEGPQSIIDGLAISDDGARLATGTIDQLVRVWSLPDGEPVAQPIQCEGLPKAILFSPNPGELTIACLGLVRTVDLSTGLDIRKAHVLTHSINAIARLDATQEFLIATASGRVTAMPQAEEEVPVFGTPGSWVFDMAIGIDGSRLLAPPRSWDLNTGAELAVVSTSGSGTVSIGPDGLEALLVSQDRVHIAGVESSKVRVETRVERGESWAGAWHPHEPLIAVGGRHGCDIHLRDSRTLERIRSFPESQRGQTRVLRFSPDGSMLAAATLESIGLRVFDVETGAIRFSLPDVPTCWSVDWSPDGRMLAASCAQEVLLFETRDWSLIGTLRGHEGTIKSLKFHPSGELLATCSEDQSVRLWNVGRRAHVLMLYGHHARCRALEWSRDGKVLATADEAGAIRLWRRH